MPDDLDIPAALKQALDEEIDGDAVDLFRDDLTEAWRREWARQEAKRLDRQHRLAGQVSKLGLTTTAAEKLASESTPLEWTVDALHARGDSTMLVAQNKVGKTTLALNLIRSLLDDEPFLGEWKVNLPEGCVGYLNYEVSKTDSLTGSDGCA